MTLEGDNVSARVLRTERPVRIDDYAKSRGSLATQVRESGVRSAIGSPIVVDGRLWGVVIAATRRTERLPTGSESHMGLPNHTAIVEKASIATVIQPMTWGMLERAWTSASGRLLEMPAERVAHRSERPI